MAAADTKAAYEAAWDIKDGTAGSGDMRLLARTRVNYKNYTGEGSMGAHNPEYIIAGLEVGTKMAKSVQGYSGFTAGGAAFPGANYFMGMAMNGDDSPAANAEIEVELGDSSTFTVMTDANGNYSFVYPSTTYVYDVTWKRCGDPLADLLLYVD